VITSWSDPIEPRQTEGGLAFGPLTTSFQRFQLPSSGTIREAPHSLGVLPLGEGGGEWLLPIADDEALWIGLNVQYPIEVAIKVETIMGQSLDALSGRAWEARAPETVSLDAFTIIAGIRRDSSTFWAFARAPTEPQAPACDNIRFFSRNRPLRLLGQVRLVDYSNFSARTGRTPPAPIDPNSGYKGYRLP
jgi:hypothetical protein